MINSFFLQVKNLKHNDGSSLIAVMILAIVAAMVLQSVTYSARSTLKTSGRQMSKVSSLNLAEAGKEKAIAELRNRVLTLNPAEMITCYDNVSFGNGAFTVKCSTNTTGDIGFIYSTGVQGAVSTTIEVVVSIEPDSRHYWFKGAAVTARTDVSTLGDIEIDGRDYDTNGINGTLLGTGGVVGVAAGGSVSAGGSSEIGGTSTAPQKAIIEGQNAAQFIDTTGYPRTPEEVLGITTAELETYRWTKAPPSNYVGIVYSDKPYDFAGGILIVHNSSNTASLGNYHNTFKGLIIADQVKHFNGSASVLGAIFMLGNDKGGNCFGNGAARIHYSSQALEKALKFIPSTGSITVKVLSWRELN